MKAFAYKSKKEQSNAVSSHVAQSQGVAVKMDSNTEAIAQRKIQNTIDSSAQVQEQYYRQKYVDNNATKTQLKSQSQPTLKNGKPSTPVAQRFIYLSIDDDDIIYTQQDGKRPPGGLPQGKQGDHTTPFTVLQNQIANAIEGVSLSDAWVNLYDTLTVYVNLPGWKESSKWVQDKVGPHVEGLLKKKGDGAALQTAVDNLLELRNQIGLTSLPKGGFGNAEGKWAGSLQYQERQFQLGNSPGLNKKGVLDYIWKAFDHGRVNNLQSQDKIDAIILQHAQTMADAYPQLNKSVGINAQAIVNHYPKQDWVNYDPD